MPNMYIIAGCNGAGKTTVAYKLLPNILNCDEFVNADEIARGISPFKPETVSFQAGRIMLNRLNELIEIKTDFAFETTLSTLSYKQLILKAKESGYFVSLIFIWLNSDKLAIKRVKNRVKSGGHNIPTDVVERRYKRGINNLANVFVNLSDYCLVVDNSQSPISLIFEKKLGTNRIIDSLKWNKINSK
jgi:predicted ABC-type ATPase